MALFVRKGKIKVIGSGFSLHEVSFFYPNASRNKCIALFGFAADHAILRILRCGRRRLCESINQRGRKTATSAIERRFAIKDFLFIV
jgi:hypothetical protein